MSSIAEAPGTTGQAGFAAQAAEAIADALTREDLDVQFPGQDGNSFLQVTNVPGALCELTICDSGLFDWQYRCLDSSRRDTAVLAAAVLRMLAGQPSDGRPPVTAEPRLTMISQAGRTLARQGMQVRLNLLDTDEQLFEIYSEIAVTNPARPDRGTIRLADGGLIRWRGQLSNPADPESGLALSELTGTLTRVLTTVLVS
jgi:hypothetical protein